MSRIYIFTGKGGVGKTSTAAAHAVKSAKEGMKTLLVSTDMAHNLGDLFGRQLGREPVEIIPNLDAYEIDPEFVIENDFREMFLSIRKMISLDSETVMDDFGIIPGMEELVSLLKIAEVYKEGSYERIIVDCAPTGETLSLLKFPELLSWYVEKFLPVGKVAIRVLAPVSKKMFKIELPNKAAMTDIERMYVKLVELQELLKDREVTSIRLVAVPEKMAVEETKRNYMYMNLYNFNVDGIYINRILPKDIGNAFFEKWLEIQGRYVIQLEECFAGLPIWRIRWYDEELQGIEAVERICKDVLLDDVFDSKTNRLREEFQENEQGYLLRVPVPYASKEEMDVYQSASDVVIKLGNFKRNIPLPDSIRSYVITSARLENDCLNMQFERVADSN